MHTKDGHPVNVNDKLWLQVLVNSTTGGLESCNCTVETVEPMFPGNNKTTIVLNTKQLVKFPPTVMMERAKVVGFNFADAVEYAKKAVKLLQTVGDTAIEVVKTTFALYTAFTDRDLSGLLAKLNTLGTDVQKIIDAVKAEFQLE